MIYLPIPFFHECALCGYPPVETSVDEMDNTEVESALARISALAERENEGQHQTTM